VIIIFLGTSHPPPLNDLSPLGEKRQAIGAFCMVMLLLCIHYAPITEVTIPEYDIAFECENPNQVVEINGSVEYQIKIINKAKERISLEFSISEIMSKKQDNVLYDKLDIDNLNWTTETDLLNSDGDIINDWKKIKLLAKDHFIVKVRISPDQNQQIGAIIEHLIKIKIKGLNTQTKNYSISTKVGIFDIFSPEPDREVKTGNLGRFNISVQNIIDQYNTIMLNYSITSKSDYNLDQFSFELQPQEITLKPRELGKIDFNVTTPFNAEPCLLIIEISGRSNHNENAMDILKLTLRIIQE
jgi:hypothetical protein